jgi:hypothetical protein
MKDEVIYGQMIFCSFALKVQVPNETHVQLSSRLFGSDTTEQPFMQKLGCSYRSFSLYLDRAERVV